eukprot:4330210-Pleurochrysis_carterae.AAC.2
MEKGGFLEMPFKSIHTFLGLHSGSTRFSVSSQSLDRVWLAWRASNYATLGAPSKVAWYKGTCAFVSSTAGQATNVEVGLPGYNAGGVYDTNSERYIGKYFKLEEPATNIPASAERLLLPTIPSWFGRMARNLPQLGRFVSFPRYDATSV